MAVDSDAPGVQPLLKGRNLIGILTLAVMVCFIAVVAFGAATLEVTSMSTLVGVAGIIGAILGYAIANATASVDIFENRVLVTNAWRVIDIPRKAIHSIYAESGIGIELIDAKLVQTSAFPAALGFRLTGNRRSRKFASQVCQLLNVQITPPGTAEDQARRRAMNMSTGATVKTRWTSVWVVLSSIVGCIFLIMILQMLHRAST